MEYKRNNEISLKYDSAIGTSDHAPIYAIVNYKQPFPKPIIPSPLPLMGDYTNLQRCKLSKINIINKDMLYINKLNKLNKQDYTNFKYKNTINFTGNLLNDIENELLKRDNVQLLRKKFKLGSTNNERLWIIFDNNKKLVKKINEKKNDDKDVDLVIDNRGIGVQFKKGGILIKENIYLLFFLLNFDFRTQYNGRLLIDAFIDEINKLL
jgi:hypothetical protein